MTPECTRRNFLSAIAKSTALRVVPGVSPVLSVAQAVQGPTAAPEVLNTFGFNGVRLLDGMFQRKYAETCNYYFNLPDDDILKGFRQRAGLPAPGQDLGGWCIPDSSVVFGQWLSGMIRMSKATSDVQMRAKAEHLMREWAKALKIDGKPYSAGVAKLIGYSHYTWDKLAGGLIDMYEFGAQADALPLLEQIVDWAAANLDRTKSEPKGFDISGFPPEWYTLPENMYRAFLLSSDGKYRQFGDAWRDEKYWSLFADHEVCNLHGYHAYSHVNSLSSAAMTYAVTRDPRYLAYIKGAYNHFQKYQCYATGGFGPAERLVAPNRGELGDALEREANTFETPCGTWAVFKLCSYLIQFTGDARFGDWIERVLYNGIGSALPMGPNGATFYYSDYRLAGFRTLGSARKEYYWAAFPCCSGTYIQSIAEIHNLIYFRNSDSIFVNLFVPSEVVWKQAGGDIVLRQETLYPEQDTSHLIVYLESPQKFSIGIRMPEWAGSLSIRVNGEEVHPVTNASWATVTRVWQNGDKVHVQIPMRLRSVPVDAQHLNRVAIVYGPVVLVQDGSYTLPLRKNGDSEDLTTQIRLMSHEQVLPSQGLAQKSKLAFRIAASAPDGVFSPEWGIFMPFHAFDQRYPYRMYFDLDDPVDTGT